MSSSIPPDPAISEDLVSQPDPLAKLSGEDELEGSHPGMVGKAGVVGAITLFSRIFGFVRDATIAYVLGAHAAADAFYVAFRIPNLLRRLLAEGNLTLAFIPVFTESQRRSKTEAKEVVDVLFTILLCVNLLVTVLGIAAAAYLVRATALGFTQDPEKFTLTVRLTRITFPYILLVSLGALAMGVLNSRRRFAIPAFSPVMLNVGIIVGAIALSRGFAVPSIGVACGVLLGGILQLGIQFPALAREGFLPKLRWRWKHPAVLKIGRLMLPSLYGSAVYQINLLAITFLASYLPTGSVSYLWYADRVVEFPLGIFAISLATVALPTLAEHAADRDFVGMKRSFRQALTMVWLINIPAAVGLGVLAQPIVSLLFFRGGFTQESTRLTAQALQCFAIGLPFAAATRITASAFYAVQEARKPVRAANLSVLVNLAVGLCLFKPLQHRGLALGVSAASICNFLLNIRDYRRKVGPLGLRNFAGAAAKMLGAVLLMAAALMALRHYWDWSFAGTAKRALYLSTMMGIGVGVYALAVLLFRIDEAESLRRMLRNKLRLG